MDHRAHTSQAVVILRGRYDSLLEIPANPLMLSLNYHSKSRNPGSVFKKKKVHDGYAQYVVTFVSYENEARRWIELG